MTDYQTTTPRNERVLDPYLASHSAEAEVRRAAMADTSTGPGGATVAARVVTFAFGILQALLIVRIVLFLLVANPANQIVDAIFSITQPFIDPFIGMFALDRVVTDQGFVVDVAAIVALLAWTLVEFVILAGLRIFSRRTADAI